MHTGFWCGSVNERCNWEDIGVDDRTAIKWILRNRLRGMNSCLSGQGQVVDCCEHGNETLGRLNRALYRLPEEMSVCQNVLYSMELLSYVEI
jgi:hypothetical protein